MEGYCWWGFRELVRIKIISYGMGEVEIFVYMFGMQILVYFIESNFKEGSYLFFSRLDLGRGQVVNFRGEDFNVIQKLGSKIFIMFVSVYFSVFK